MRQVDLPDIKLTDAVVSSGFMPVWVAQDLEQPAAANVSLPERPAPISQRLKSFAVLLVRRDKQTFEILPLI